MTTIALDLGHGVNPDRGAEGLLTEESVINNVGDCLANMLVRAGYTVKMVRPQVACTSVTTSLQSRCSKANAAGADYFISLHCNAFDGSAEGSEIFAVSAKGAKLAAHIQSKLVDLGFTDRGVKPGNRLYVLKNTSAVAVLVELFFIDSPEDVARYRKVGSAEMAKAIFDGLTDFLR